MRKIADTRYACAVLQWDQETYLPAGGANARGKQIATLSEIAHDLFSSPSLGDLLLELSDSEDLNEKQKKNISLTLDDYNKNKKYSSAFVRKMSEQITLSFHAWIEARKKNNYSILEPELDRLLQLKKEESYLLGFSGHIYDPHLNEHDKGLTVSITDQLFKELTTVLKTLTTGIYTYSKSDAEILHQYIPKDIQWKLGLDLLKFMGFNFESGRQDISEHPFTISFHPTDVRLTTRINENDFTKMLWSCIHEGGHGLYEQGLPETEYGLPLGEYCSLSIHESQSRLWENCIGRSRPFCDFVLGLLKKSAPDQFSRIEPSTFYRALNTIKPSLIRTEADEVTYHYHILIRYELEKQLIEGSISTKELPYYWNSFYKNFLGLDVPDDNRGCLQDVHWAHGSFGYFPTYTLGSLYAVQFFDTYKKYRPGWENDTLNGDFTHLKNWLENNIYQQGKYYNSLELCNICTGEPLQISQFEAYLDLKFKSQTASIYE